MSKYSDQTNRHENYEILNLIGYGMAKFNMAFVREFGFKTKTAFYDYLIGIKIAETSGVIKNRQDLFDPFFENGRKGWWQKGDAYIHRKIVIDKMLGNLDVKSYAKVIKIYLKEKFKAKNILSEPISPIYTSRFRTLQTTGLEAEEYFMNNYHLIEDFNNGKLEDARIYGDGYDFQIDIDRNYYLVEIKGVKTNRGEIRFTEKEFITAKRYKDQYALVVVNNLIDEPKFSLIYNPTFALAFKEKERTTNQITYHTFFKE